MNTIKPPEKIDRRLYYLDALRVIAVLLLVPFHVGLIYAPFFLFIIPGDERSRLIGGVVVAFLHIWHMPLFFLISGAAARFSLAKRTVTGYLSERVTRLFIPLLVGMAVAIAPQRYIELRWWIDLEQSYFEWYPQFWTTGFVPEGNLTWHHLWFLVYLFTYSLITLPLLAWLRGDRGQRLIAGLTARLRGPLGPLLLMVPTLLTEWIFRARWPGYQNLIDDWANFTLYLWFFVAGYLIITDADLMARIKRGRRAWLALALPPTAAIVAAVTLTGERLTFAYTDPLYAVYVVGITLATWGWVLAALGYGQVWLNRETPLLRYTRRVAYPFYIVHQAWIVWLAFLVVPLSWSIAAQFALIAAGTVLLSGLSADLIHRIPGVRLLFGVK